MLYTSQDHEVHMSAFSKNPQRKGKHNRKGNHPQKGNQSIASWKMAHASYFSYFPSIVTLKILEKRVIAEGG